MTGGTKDRPPCLLPHRVAAADCRRHRQPCLPLTPAGGRVPGDGRRQGHLPRLREDGRGLQRARQARHEARGAAVSGRRVRLRRRHVAWAWPLHMTPRVRAALCLPPLLKAHSCPACLPPHACVGAPFGRCLRSTGPTCWTSWCRTSRWVLGPCCRAADAGSACCRRSTRTPHHTPHHTTPHHTTPHHTTPHHTTPHHTTPHLPSHVLGWEMGCAQLLDVLPRIPALHSPSVHLPPRPLPPCSACSTCCP